MTKEQVIEEIKAGNPNYFAIEICERYYLSRFTDLGDRQDLYVITYREYLSIPKENRY